MGIFLYLCPNIIFSIMHKLINQLKTYYSFGIFVLYIFFVGVPAGWLYSLSEKNKAKNQDKYHKHVAHFCRRFLRHYLCCATHEIRNPYHETFKTPALIIANHQSILDLPFTMMMSPKLVVMTGQWVWESKLYGKVVKFCDYFPSSLPMDEMLVHIKDVMSRGYSVLIFPEGTRSEDCQVHTFRRGAFHLAEQLRCDIIPMVLWGTGRVLPKNEFCLHDGHMVLDIGKRERFDDGVMGEGHGALTRYWHKYFLQRFAELEEENLPKQSN